jgi:putative membrane protein
MSVGEALPTVNAALNATTAALLAAGFWAVRSGSIERHRKLMLAAFGTSTAFLVSYLVRFALTGTHRYPGQGWDRTLYLGILGTHTLLASVVVPLALWTLYLSLIKRRFADHKRVARWALPVWLYVSVTGVVVYLMLYHLAPQA